MRCNLFQHECSVKRAAPVGTNGRQSKVQIATAVRSLFIPMASRVEIENGWAIGTGYDVYFEGVDADVLAGDQLIYDGATFNVRGVRTYKARRVSHKHALATREGV